MTERSDAPTTDPRDAGDRPLSGVILAGGHGRRMGADKATVAVGGQQLIDIALGVLADLTDDVVVARGDQPPLGRAGARDVPDTVADAGPLAGLVAGLEAARHDRVVVLAVDLPRASAEVLRRCAARLDGAVDAAVPVVGGRREPLHAAYDRRARTRLRARLGAADRSLRGALDVLTVVEIGPEAWADVDAAGAFARNVNRPGDLDLDDG